MENINNNIQIIKTTWDLDPEKLSEDWEEEGAANLNKGNNQSHGGFCAMQSLKLCTTPMKSAVKLWYQPFLRTDSF